MSEIPPYGQPSGYSNYPRGYSQTPYTRPPGVYLDAISRAWQLVQANMGVWVLSMLIAFGLYYAAMFAMQFAIVGSSMFSLSRRADPTMSLVLIPIELVLGVAFQILITGMMAMGVKQVRNEPIGVGDIWSAFPRGGHLILGSILQGILTLVGFCLCIVPMFYVIGLVVLVPLLIVDQRLNAIEAVETCWNNLRPHAWSLFGVTFLAGIIGGLGMCLCGFGMLFTYPVYILTVAILYTDLFPQQYDNAAYNQQIGMEPPR